MSDEENPCKLQIVCRADYQDHYDLSTPLLLVSLPAVAKDWHKTPSTTIYRSPECAKTRRLFYPLEPVYIITTKQVEDAGLSRTILKPFVEEGLLLKESQGIYSLSEAIVDEYKLIQIRSDNAVFSYGTGI